MSRYLLLLSNYFLFYLGGIVPLIFFVQLLYHVEWIKARVGVGDVL